MPPKGYKSSTRKSSKSPANPSPSQRPCVSQPLLLRPLVQQRAQLYTNPSTSPVPRQRLMLVPSPRSFFSRSCQQLLLKLLGDLHHTIKRRFRTLFLRPQLSRWGASTSTEQPAIVSGIVEEALQSVHSAIA
ncbi:Hypothetical predicted protein, partial [Paramuricea clavata]